MVLKYFGQMSSKSRIGFVAAALCFVQPGRDEASSRNWEVVAATLLPFCYAMMVEARHAARYARGGGS